MAFGKAIWPQLIESWKYHTWNSVAKGASLGTASTSFGGVGYLASLHRDHSNFGFTFELSLHCNPRLPDEAGAMVIPEYGVSRKITLHQASISHCSRFLSTALTTHAISGTCSVTCTVAHFTQITMMAGSEHRQNRSFSQISDVLLF